MKQFVSRRRRCWTLLVQMDLVICLSQGPRSDMLLDLRGLTREERVMIQDSIGNERDFDFFLPKFSSFNIHEFVSTRIEDTSPETREKEKAKTKTALRRSGGFSSRWSRSKGKGQTTAYYADNATDDDYDNDDDAGEPKDSCQAHNDPAGPDSADDTSSSCIAHTCFVGTEEDESEPHDQRHLGRPRYGRTPRRKRSS